MDLPAFASRIYYDLLVHFCFLRYLNCYGKSASEPFRVRFFFFTGISQNPILPPVLINFSIFEVFEY